MNSLGSPWRALPALLYTAALLYGGVIDVGPLPKLPHLATDKLLHAAAFAGLAVLVEFALWRLAPRRRRWLAVGVSTGVGALLELVQSALPYRSAELLDLLADGCGAVLGVLLMAWILRLWEARSPRVSVDEM
jgi:VanZ family protein